MNLQSLSTVVFFVLFALASPVLQGLSVASPKTVVVEKGGGDLWSHLKIRMSNITEIKTTDRPGWRNNGTGFSATTSGDLPVTVNFDVSGKGNISYVDYTVTLLVKDKNGGQKLLGNTEKIPASGGSSSYSYTWSPDDTSGPLQLSISISGGNPETFTYYVDGIISSARPQSRKAPEFTRNIGTSGAAFTGLNGDVQVSRDGGVTWEFAKRETPLNWGDHVRTGEDTKVTIGLVDMSTFEMRSESEIILAKPEGRSPLRLLAGNLWVNVNRMLEGGSMEIEMNQAVAGIKGTTFELWENRKGASVLKVTEGLVSFRHKITGQKMNVSAGQTFTATPTRFMPGNLLNSRVASVVSDGEGSLDTGKPRLAAGSLSIGKAYFFRGNQYIRYDTITGKPDPGYPKPINSETWPGLPWTGGIDALLNWGNGKAYLFKGDEYVRIDIKADRVDPGYPKPISSWPGVWSSGIDAAVNWGNGKAYLFKGNQYLRYDISSDRVDPGYPKSLSAWPGVWSSGIDAAVNWGNGKAYLFKGNQYLRFDIQADQVDPGYPKTIDDSTWPGLWN